MLEGQQANAEKTSSREAWPQEEPSIDALIDEYAARYHVRVGLVRAVVRAESSFNSHALSSKGAMGLMQLMPATARHFGVTDAFDPSENVRAGVAYLRHLLDRYRGNERLALAAYNAGPTTVDRFAGAAPPYPETIEHADRTLGSVGADAPPTEMIADGR